MSAFKFKQPFINKFPGDDTHNPMQRQTPNDMYARVETIGFPKAKLIAMNEELIHKEFDLDIASEDFKNLLNGNPSSEIDTYATAYAGHQFGNWAGQLGDGRAIYLGEIKGSNGEPWEWQYKGAGATPYSRRGDGRAVLRSTIREFLMSEAMHYLNVPSTRSISLSLSGEEVVRDIMYDGNPTYEKGALMIRGAQSFLRFGHFEFLSANQHTTLLKRLADYTIDRYYPWIQSIGINKYLDFFTEVLKRTIDLIIHWYRVGFVHGVMNTDNMSILGLTIDYGPFAMLDEYELRFTSNTTDLPGRRYAFGQQGSIALWNLNILANAIYPLIGETKPLEIILESFEKEFWSKFDAMMADKLGFDELGKNDTDLIKDWQVLMLKLKLDYTLFFTELMNIHDNRTYEINLEKISYKTIQHEDRAYFGQFLDKYSDRINQNNISSEQAKEKMKLNNPNFTLRNYLLYEATQDAEKGDFNKFFKLWDALKTPYKQKFPEFCQKRPEWANGVPGCSMLSCSS